MIDIHAPRLALLVLNSQYLIRRFEGNINMLDTVGQLQAANIHCHDDSTDSVASVELFCYPLLVSYVRLELERKTSASFRHPYFAYTYNTEENSQ